MIFKLKKKKMMMNCLKMKLKKECLKKTANNYQMCNLGNIHQQMKYKHLNTFKKKKLTKLIGVVLK